MDAFMPTLIPRDILRLSMLPLELLIITVSFLKLQDVKSVRQVCRSLNAASSEFLITSAWISCNPDDWDVLENISEHPIFRRTIREIKYDGTVYDVDLSPQKLYYTLCSLPAMKPPPWNPSPRQPTSKALSWSHDQYMESIKNQQDLFSYTGDHMTKIGAPLPTTMVKTSARKNRRIFGTPNHPQAEAFEELLPDDLLILLQCLARMPNVASLQFRCDRYFRSDRFLICSPSGLWSRPTDPSTPYNHGPVTIEQTLDPTYVPPIDPRMWSPRQLHPSSQVDSYRAWCRGFFVLAQASAMLGLSGVKCLLLGGYKSSTDFGGISAQMFTMSAVERAYVSAALYHVKELVLTINTHGNRTTVAFNDSDLLETLRSAVSLEHISMCFDAAKNCFIPRLRTFFASPSPWHALQAFVLINCETKAEHLGPFLRSVSGTLQELELQNILLFHNQITNSGANQLRNFFRQLSPLPHCKVLKLEAVFCWNPGRTAGALSVFKSSHERTIQTFLGTGGYGLVRQIQMGQAGPDGTTNSNMLSMGEIW